MFCALCMLVLPVNYTTDPGDGIQHYYFAKNLFSIPKNFFNLWAKPLFTLFAAPFAQFGIKGMHFFNILCAAGTFYLLIRISAQLQLRIKLFSAMVFLLIPVYFPLICSAMTEPFFACVLTLCIFFFTAQKYIHAAIVMAFLPFARQEGYLLIPVMFVTLLLMKKFRALPFLFSGVLIFSLIGQFALGDFLWLLHDNPYTGASGIYGHGTLTHFIEGSEIIFGFPVQVFAALSIVLLIWQLIQYMRQKKKKEALADTKFTSFFLLISGSFAVFFMAHTLMWWKGLNGSLGLFRVMACIAPLAALLCHYTFHTLSIHFTSVKTITATAFLFITVCAIILFTRNGFPPEKGEEILLTEKAGDVLIQRKLINRHLYFSSPWLPFYLGKNPGTDTSIKELSSSPAFKKGDVIVWDAHFGPAENGFAEQQLHNDTAFSIIYILKSETGLKTLKDRDFKVIIAEKK